MNNRCRRRRASGQIGLIFFALFSFSTIEAAFSAENAGVEPLPLSLIESGHFKRARAIVEERYRSNPKDPETLWLMSRIKQEFFDSEAAFDFAKKASAADPQNSRYHSRVASTAGWLALNVNFLRMISLARRAKKEVDIALTLDPNNVEALKILGLYYLQAPFFLGGNKTKARAIPDRIIQIDPVEGYFAHVYLANHEKQYDRIEKLYLQAAEAQPESWAVHQSLADYYLGQKRLQEGEKHAREAIRIDPGRISAHLSLIALLVTQNKMSELDTALKDAERAVPDNLMPYFAVVAWCHPKGMAIQRCVTYLRKYLTQEPEPNMASHAQAHRLLGIILSSEGRRSEGIAELQTALRLDPNSPAKQDLKKLGSQ
jgi:tetratricopeptide (TPR) repeat protein